MLKWAPSNKYLQLLWHLYWTSQSHFSKNRRLLWAIVCSGSLKLLEVKTFNVRKRKNFFKTSTNSWLSFRKRHRNGKKPLMLNEVLRFWLYWRSGRATAHLREIMGLTDFWGWICSCRSTFLSDICTQKITRKISSVFKPGTAGRQASRLPLRYSFPQVSSNIVSDFNSFFIGMESEAAAECWKFHKRVRFRKLQKFFSNSRDSKTGKRKKESSLRNSSLVSVWVKGGGREVYI